MVGRKLKHYILIGRRANGVLERVTEEGSVVTARQRRGLVNDHRLSAAQQRSWLVSGHGLSAVMVHQRSKLLDGYGSSAVKARQRSTLVSGQGVSAGGPRECACCMFCSFHTGIFIFVMFYDQF